MKFKITPRSTISLIVKVAAICTALFIVISVFPSRAEAMPAIPHRLKGRVVSVDIDKRIIDVTSSDGKKSIRLEVDAKQTRITRDGHYATLPEAKPGDTITAYYKRNSAQFTATEIKLDSRGSTNRSSGAGL